VGACRTMERLLNKRRVRTCIARRRGRKSGTSYAKTISIKALKDSTRDINRKHDHGGLVILPVFCCI
jgi:hypothetical protein